jgi:hypothetical protein
MPSGKVRNFPLPMSQCLHHCLGAFKVSYGCQTAAKDQQHRTSKTAIHFDRKGSKCRIFSVACYMAWLPQGQSSSHSWPFQVPKGDNTRFTVFIDRSKSKIIQQWEFAKIFCSPKPYSFVDQKCYRLKAGIFLLYILNGSFGGVS